MTFYALTIGPIYRTLETARYTRELWAASYTFSWLMKQIASSLRAGRNEWGIEILMPYMDDPHLFGPAVSDKPERYRMGAGLFPDRIIFRRTEDAPLSSDQIFKNAQDAARNAFKLLASKIAAHFGWKNKAPIETFLDQYFHLYLVEQELADAQNFAGQLGPHLDALELQPSVGTVHRPFLELLFDRVNNSFLVKDGFGEDRVSFETLVEIACRDFEADPKYRQLIEERTNRHGSIPLPEDEGADLPSAIFADRTADRNNDEELVKHLSTNCPDEFRFPHKYIAIILSDGDNVGKINESLPLTKMSDYSKDMHDFALNSVEKVKQYGGQPIFAAGDDLMFFAPVIRSEAGNVIDHVFRLLSDLDADFKKCFGKYNTSPSPSLSFGVSITYYKYPLAEALGAARDLLFQKAKSGNKNKIAFAALKHSGHEFGGAFTMKSESWHHVLAMLADRKDWKLLRSVIHKIRQNEQLFSLLAQNEIQLGNFLDNSFNEEIHGQAEAQKWLEEVKNLIIKIFREGDTSETSFDKLYGALRLISFINESGTEK